MKDRVNITPTSKPGASQSSPSFRIMVQQQKDAESVTPNKRVARTREYAVTEQQLAELFISQELSILHKHYASLPALIKSHKPVEFRHIGVFEDLPTFAQNESRPRIVNKHGSVDSVRVAKSLNDHPMLFTMVLGATSSPAETIS